MTKNEGLKFYPGLVGNKRVLVLRDSGSTAVLIRESFVHQNEYTGKQVKVTAFDGSVKYLPTAWINITTPFYSGKVEALVTAAQPVDLIIGNIEGVRECTEQDLIDWTNTIKVSEEQCNAALTRSMTKENTERERPNVN